MPTEIRITAPPLFTTDYQLVALFSFLPFALSLVLARAYPAIAGALVLLGQLS